MRVIKFIKEMVLDPVFLSKYRLRKTLEEVLSAALSEGAYCLDVGCGDRPYEKFFSNAQYVGVDVEDSGRPLSMKRPDRFYDGKVLPFTENSFDIVMSTQVLEHVPEPLKFIEEMARVCKKNGAIILTLPFVFQEHEEPYDYFRFSSFGIASLLHKAGLDVELIKKDSTGIETIAVLLNVYVVNNLIPPIKGIGFLCSVFFCFPLQLFAIMLAKLLPNSGQLFLNIVVLARKP